MVVGGVPRERPDEQGADGRGDDEGQFLVVDVLDGLLPAAGGRIARHRGGRGEQLPDARGFKLGPDPLGDALDQPVQMADAPVIPEILEGPQPEPDLDLLVTPGGHDLEFLQGRHPEVDAIADQGDPARRGRRDDPSAAGTPRRPASSSRPRPLPTASPRAKGAG